MRLRRRGRVGRASRRREGGEERRAAGVRTWVTEGDGRILAGGDRTLGDVADGVVLAAARHGDAKKRGLDSDRAARDDQIGLDRYIDVDILPGHRLVRHQAQVRSVHLLIALDQCDLAKLRLFRASGTRT